MTPTEFCYWLQGYFELRDNSNGPHKLDDLINSKQANLIRQHLALVFAHSIDPKAGPPEHQQLLNNIHNSENDIRPRC